MRMKILFGAAVVVLLVSLIDARALREDEDHQKANKNMVALKEAEPCVDDWFGESKFCMTVEGITRLVLDVPRDVRLLKKLAKFVIDLIPSPSIIIEEVKALIHDIIWQLKEDPVELLLKIVELAGNAILYVLQLAGFVSTAVLDGVLHIPNLLKFVVVLPFDVAIGFSEIAKEIAVADDPVQDFKEFSEIMELAVAAVGLGNSFEGLAAGVEKSGFPIIAKIIREMFTNFMDSYRKYKDKVFEYLSIAEIFVLPIWRKIVVPFWNVYDKTVLVLLKKGKSIAEMFFNEFPGLATYPSNLELMESMCEGVFSKNLCRIPFEYVVYVDWWLSGEFKHFLHEVWRTVLKPIFHEWP